MVQSLEEQNNSLVLQWDVVWKKVDKIIRKYLATLMMDGVEITRQQLDKFKAALVVANSKMEVAMRYGDQARNFSLYVQMRY